MVYLPTFGLNLMVNVGKYTQSHGSQGSWSSNIFCWNLVADFFKKPKLWGKKGPICPTVA